MGDADDNLTTTIRQLERGLDSQKEAVDHLSGKAAIVLGLAALALIAIAGLDRASLAARPANSTIAISFLVVSTAVLARTYLGAAYPNKPNPAGLLGRIDRPARSFDENLAAAMLSSYKKNERRVDGQFRLLNRGIAWFLAGVVIYGAGVGFR